MAEFGTHAQKDGQQIRDYAGEMQEAAGAKCPVSTTVDRDGSLIGASYDVEWLEGGTEPVQDATGKIVDYKEDYTKKKLTKDQQKALDAYISENLKTE